MAQWGRNDHSVTANSTTTKETSNGAPIGTYALVKGDQVSRVNGANAHFGNTSPGTRAKVDVGMFQNTTVGAFIAGKAVGVFGIDPYEMQNVGGPLVETYITKAGSGYKANAAVTVTVTSGGTSGVVNAQVSTSGATRGRVTQLKIQTAGSGYKANPTITIAAPDLLIFNGNTNVTPNASIGAFISYASANSYLQVNDKVKYAGNATSTPVTLFDNRPYYISFANNSGFKLSDSIGSANINFAKANGDGTTAGGATIQGETATGYVVSGGAKNHGATHAGWVLRTEGTGGRAGRVQYETLVAMGSLGVNETTSTGVTGNANTVTDTDGNTFIPPNND
jgi:hypothetical protein